MTTKEYNAMMQKYNFDHFIKGTAVNLAKARRCFHWLDDIKAAGYHGLVTALANYDEKFGENTTDANSFVSYVTTSIRGYMLMFIDTKSRLVRLPKNDTYIKNRDFEVGENLLDITIDVFDQIDPATDETHEDYIEYEVDDTKWIWDEAIRQVSLMTPKGSKKWPQKMEFVKRKYKLAEYKDSPDQTMKTIFEDIGIDQNTATYSIKQFKKLITEKYNQLYNQYIRAQIKRQNE